MGEKRMVHRYLRIDFEFAVVAGLLTHMLLYVQCGSVVPRLWMVSLNGACAVHRPPLALATVPRNG